MPITPGATSQIIDVRIENPYSPTNDGLTGLLYNSTGLVARYKRANATSWTSITLATMTAGTWVSGGFIAIANGWYQLGLPDAAVAAGAAYVDVELAGATGMAVTPVHVTLDDLLCTRFAGITSFAAWIKAMLRSSTADTTALTEINTGGGTYTPSTDSQEAIGSHTETLGAGNTFTLNPVQNGTLNIIQGDGYLNADGRAIAFTKEAGQNWPTNITGATVTLAFTRNADKATVTAGGDATLSVTGTVVTPTGSSQSVRFDLAVADTDTLDIGTGAYDFRIRVSGGSVGAVSTIATGLVNVVDN